MGQTAAEDGRAEVRRYYDVNSWKFLVTGSVRGLHRELWGPGVMDRRQAVHHAHALVLAELGPDERKVLDLGCGVGAAASYLADRLPLEVVGVSISPAQIRLAERYAARAGQRPGTVRFTEADFTELPKDLADVDLAFAIESFVHADPAAAFFREAARVLRPGGALVVLDDVRTGDPADPRLADFQAGWHAPASSRWRKPPGSRPPPAWSWSAPATCRPCNGCGAPATGSSTPPSRCSASGAAARCGPTRWSAGMRCSGATSPVCWSTACSASSAAPVSRS